MMPIRGDIAMNGILYPDAQVANSFAQLDMLPAPNGHPTVNGVNVSAFHPVANNKHNIGGFIRNPRKKGKRVFTDFLIDTTVANQTEEGREVLKRIESGDKVGVSTGLTINEITEAKGSDDFGKSYNKIGAGFQFDHVAILLNDMAAGDHAGTELVLNEDGEKIIVCELSTNELSVEEIFNGLNELVRAEQPDNMFSWVQEIMPESQFIIYKTEAQSGGQKLFKRSYTIDANDEIILLDDTVEVVKKTEFETKTKTKTPEGLTMNEAFILSLIANSVNGLTIDDKDRLTGMSESELAKALVQNELTTDAAKDLLTTNGYDLVGYDNFVANADSFAEFVASKDAERDTIVNRITEKSEYTTEMLVNKNLDELVILNGIVNPKSTDRALEGETVINSDDSATADVDYSA
jgi:hypothetical protein